VTLSFAANPNTTTRTGSVTIAGKTVTVTQAAAPPPPVVCDYGVNPTSLSLPSTGSAASISVLTGETCNWQASSQSNWITLQGASTGTGSGSVSLSIAPNPNPTPRTGSVTVAGKSVTVAQEGEPVLPTLTLSQTKVLLSVAAGTDQAAEASITVSSSDGSIPFQVTGLRPAWLQVSTSSSSTTATMRLAATAGSLQPGDYTATLLITSGASSNASVPLDVAFRVTKPARLRANPRALSLRLEEGNKSTVQMIQVRSTDSGAPLVVSTSGATWLSAQTQNSGRGLKTLLRASSNGLIPGIYNTDVRAYCLNGECESVTIPVRLEVTAANTVANTTRISSGGVVSAASFQQGVTEGSWMSLFGTNLSRENRMWDISDFDGAQMPRTLSGVSVRVDGKPAAMHYISNSQVNFQVPAGIGLGWVKVEIRSPLGTDETFVHVTREAPGLFQFDGAGQIAAITSDGKPVVRRALGDSGPGVTARPGQVVSLFGTGFGPTDPVVEPGQIFSGAAPLVANGALEITIGGVPAQVLFAGLAGAGLNQVNVVVPQLPPGDHEVELSIDGVPAQFGGKLAVQ
jgi:uncharacterized protein (TIGR03437 family)